MEIKDKWYVIATDMTFDDALSLAVGDMLKSYLKILR